MPDLPQAKLAQSNPAQKEARLRGPLSLKLQVFQVSVFSTVTMVPVMPAPELDRRQFDIRDAGRDIQPGLALHAERLQPVGILRTADQKVAAETDTDRRVGAQATVIAREFAALKPAA